MNDLSERIKAREKKSRQIKFANTLLSVVVIIFIVISVMLYSNLKKEKAALLKSESDLQTSNSYLAKKDSLLNLQNEKLLQIRGSIDKFWDDADNSGKIKDYANYLKRAIVGDTHYEKALHKMNTLAEKRGYVQITDSDGTKYLKKIENLNTDDQYYEVTKAMKVNYGAKGHPDFKNKNTSQKGNEVVQNYDVVKIIKIYTYNSGAEWAEIGYQ